MREFDALCKRRRADEENDTYRTASIVCSIYNVNRGKGVAPLCPEDFMAKKDRPKQSPGAMLAAAKAIQNMAGKKPPGG